MTPNSPPFDAEFPGLAAALAGAYRIERELGRGGMGVVFLARDERLDRQVALKVLPPAPAADPNVRERFLREARTSAQLAHPNIVPIYSADEAGEWAYFAMAFIDGETLGQRVAALGPLEPEEVVRLLRDAAWALAYAHARGLVHRDVKPDNLLVERHTGRLVVTDFGIAHAPEATPLTQTGLVMGSVHFMSPEQGAGDVLDGRSDLYSLGTVGYLLLSGKLPFEHEQPSAILVQRATRVAPSLASVAPEVPQALVAVIDQCLSRDPEMRPATGEALAEQLELAWRDATAQESTRQQQRSLSETEAHLVWQRAAQLQAQAAARLESQTRERLSLGAPRGMADASEGAGSTPEDGVGAGAGGTAPQPQASGGFAVAHVQAAAEEAGISRQYVALALAELKSDREAGTALAARAAEQGAVTQVLLGKHPRAISVTRLFDFVPREVLAAMGVALQRTPCGLRLRDTIGGHALHGGTLVFDLPAMEYNAVTGGTSGTYLWSATRYQLWIKTLRAQITSAPGGSGRTEVTFTIEPPEGHNNALWTSVGISCGAGAVGGLVGAILVKKAVLVTLLGFPAALPLVAGGLLLGAIGNRVYYRSSLRTAKDEMNKALDEIARELKLKSIVGDPFGDPLRKPLRSG